MDTPKIKKPTFQVPDTPNLTRLGYGTGVGVFHLERSVGATVRSPWALKKVLRTHKNGSYGDHIKSEASILSKMRHPNIIGFRGLSKTADGREVLAMEECSRCLGDMIEERYEQGLGCFPVKNIIRVAFDMANALDYIHNSVKIMHGDIKSFNVLVNGDFEVAKLCDFGVSIKVDEKGKAIGNYIGTEIWSAPEALANKNVTTKADIFSLGVVLWEMISLTPPHLGENPEELTDDSICYDDSYVELDTTEYGTRPKLPELLSEDYKVIVDIFNLCTEQDPQNRPSAKELIEKLEPLL